MKVATIAVRITPEATVKVFNITPMEALLLTAEHHTSVGGAPFDPEKIVEETQQVPLFNETQEPVLGPDGKHIFVTPPWADAKWTKNQEIKRLKR